jgi:hypothetical protein
MNGMIMKFAESQFAEAVELLQSIDPTRSRGDKRRANRTEIRVSIEIRACNKAAECPWTTGTLRDLSPRGVRLEAKCSIEANESFLLKLPTKDKTPGQLPLICRVAYCTPQKESFIIGAEFIGRQYPQQSQSNLDAERGRIRKLILG